MLAEVLIPRLLQRFPGRGMRVGVPPSACAVFPAIHPDVGNVEIFDDGDELTLVAGNFTHGHFSNYNEDLSPEAKAEQIGNEVIAFLESLFSDRIVLWGSHVSAGGWYDLGREGSARGKDTSKYVWSGPLT